MSVDPCIIGLRFRQICQLRIRDRLSAGVRLVGCFRNILAYIVAILIYKAFIRQVLDIFRPDFSSLDFFRLTINRFIFIFFICVCKIVALSSSISVPPGSVDLIIAARPVLCGSAAEAVKLDSAVCAGEVFRVFISHFGKASRVTVLENRLLSDLGFPFCFVLVVVHGIIAVGQCFLIAHNTDKACRAFFIIFVRIAARAKNIAGGKAIRVSYAVARADEAARTHACTAVIEQVDSIVQAHQSK